MKALKSSALPGLIVFEIFIVSGRPISRGQFILFLYII
jgi:hypothetical protein